MFCNALPDDSASTSAGTLVHSLAGYQGLDALQFSHHDRLVVVLLPLSVLGRDPNEGR